MRIFWTFDIDTYRWSTQDVTFGGTNYTARILPESFQGIQMRWNIGNRSLISPSEIDFKIDNSDGTLSRAALEGKFCTITCVINGAISRKWTFKLQRATTAYKILHVYCVDILQAVLFGEYPNTPHPREQWVSANHEPKDGEHDSYRIPIIFGEAYIPLMYVYRALNDTGYYVLGKDEAYTIIEVKSPAEIAKLVWDNTYTFTQISDGGYKIAQFFIVPSGVEGVYDAGTWQSHLKPLVRYRKTSGSTTNPSAIMSATLQDFGLESSLIDTSGTWASAASWYSHATRTIAWNGGVYESREKEGIIGEMLALCDSLFYVSDKVELHPFSKTSIETINISKTIKGSFRSSRITFNYNDSGHIAWAEDGYPQNRLMGKAVVPSKSGGTKDNPTKETFNCTYINDSIAAQKLGILYFQRKLTGQDNISLETTAAALATIDTIKPGNVITVNDTMFGESRDMVISFVHIKPDGKVAISGNTFEQLDDFDSISVSPISVPEDGTLYMSDNLLQLKADSLIFKFDAGGNPVPVDQVINFEAVSSQTNAGNFEFTTSPDIKAQTDASNEFTLTVAEFGENESVKVTVQQGYAIDYTTIFRVSDGSGVSGKTVSLTATDAVFKYDSDGLTPLPISSLVTATAFNLSEDLAVVISYDFYLNSILVQSGAETAYSYTPQAERANMPESIEVRVVETVGTESEVVAISQMFMIGIQDGEQGLDAGNWGSTLVFSSSAPNIVDWSSGSLYTPGAMSYLINAGSTGEMAIDTVYYIYFNPELSPILQVTTSAVDVVGDGFILVAVAKAQPEADSAFFQAFGGAGGLLIAGEHIAGNTITGNHFIANLITTSKIRNPVSASTQEVNSLFLGGATGGTFLLGNGVSTAPAIAYNATNSEIQASLESLYGEGTVVVTTAADFNITFDALVGESGLTADFTGLTGATGPSLATVTSYAEGFSNLIIDFNNSEIIVNNPEGLIVDASGGVKITQNSSIGFADAEGNMKWQMTPTFLDGFYHGLEIKPIGTEFLTGLGLGSSDLPMTIAHAYVSTLFAINAGQSRYTFKEEGLLPEHALWPEEDAPSLGSAAYPWGDLYAKLGHNHMWSGDSGGKSVALPTHVTQTFRMSMTEYLNTAYKNPNTLYLITGSQTQQDGTSVTLSWLNQTYPLYPNYPVDQITIYD